MKRSLAHISELDGLRGCAALAVYILHLCITIRDKETGPMPAAWGPVFRVIGLGSFGVDVFFVLSGFLITSLLLVDRPKPHYFRNFYWKRVLRIQPVYMIHLLATWFLVPQSHGYVLLALLFIVNFDGLLGIPDVGPAWTLSIEEQFYLLWPQVIRRLSLRHTYWVSIALIAFSAGLRLGMSLFRGHFAARYTPYRYDGLAMGALLACQWIEESNSQSVQIRRFLGFFNADALLWLCGVYEALLVLVPGYTSPAIALFTTNYLVYRTIRFILHHPGSRRFAWLRSRPLVFFGAISYSLYMFHTTILFLYDEHTGPLSFAPGPFLVRAIVVTGITVSVCVLTRRFIELPASRLRRYVVR
ncbi:MAG: acyltransferase family protein [Janthinobacterium lividum]